MIPSQAETEVKFRSDNGVNYPDHLMIMLRRLQGRADTEKHKALNTEKQNVQNIDAKYMKLPTKSFDKYQFEQNKVYKTESNQKSSSKVDKAHKSVSSLNNVYQNNSEINHVKSCKNLNLQYKSN